MLANLFIKLALGGGGGGGGGGVSFVCCINSALF